MTDAHSVPVEPAHLIAALLAGPHVPPAAVLAAATLPAPWPAIAAAAAPAEAATGLLRHPQPLVRTIALRRSGDTGALHRACRSTAARTRAAAVANPTTPVDDLAERVLHDEDHKVVVAGAINSATPTDAVRTALTRRPLGHRVMPNHAEGWQNTAKPRLAAARAVLVAHPALAPVLAVDPDPAVRHAVAAEPDVDAGSLELLRRHRMNAPLAAALGGNPSVPEEELPALPSALNARDRIADVIGTPGWQELLVSSARFRVAAAQAGSETLDALLLRAGPSTDVAEAQFRRLAQPLCDGYTVAATVQQLGMAGFAHTRWLGSTRVRAGELASPLLAALNAARLPEKVSMWDPRAAAPALSAAASAATQVTAVAGDDPLTWRTLLSTLDSWSGPLTADDAVTVVTGITG